MAENSEAIRRLQEQIEAQQKQLNALTGADNVTYPWKAGDMVILPADERNHRRIIIVPKHDLAVSNIGLLKGVELYEGEIPECGYIIDNRKHKAFTTAPASTQSDPNAPPADFSTNKPPDMSELDKVRAVMAGILALGPLDFNKTNSFPKVDALTKIVGFEVVGETRDAAWALFQKSQPNWKPPVASEAEEPAQEAQQISESTAE